MSPISRLLSFALVIAALLVVVGCDGLFYDLTQLDGEFDDELGCTPECVVPEHGSVACVEGACEISCNEGFVACGGQCVDLENDDEHCGTCDESCGENRCVAGSCADCDADARPFGGGEGTSSEPYLLCSPEHLTEMLDGEQVERPLNDDFSLYGDIDMEGETLGASAVFGGIFDGRNNTISNLNIENRIGYTGLFSRLIGTAEVTDLKVDNLVVSSPAGGDGFTGGIAGEARPGTLIQNVTLDRLHIDNQASIGGVVAHNQGAIEDVVLDEFAIDLAGAERNREFGGVAAINEGTIRNVQATGSIGMNSSDDIDFAGGLVGLNDGEIRESMADIDFGDMAAVAIGGLVGENGGTITDSYSVGTVRGRLNVGGLVGTGDGDIESSYSAASVDGTDGVGGLVGELVEFGKIDDSYATGSVDAENNLGGLVGFVWREAYIRDSYSTGMVASEASVETSGGFTGNVQPESDIFNCHWDRNTSSMDRATGTGLTLEASDVAGLESHEFTSPTDGDHFVGWDFEEIWNFGTAPDDRERPIFRWQSGVEP